MSSVDTIIRRVLEDEDDDFSSKEMEVNLMRIGDRVLIANEDVQARNFVEPQ